MQRVTFFMLVFAQVHYKSFWGIVFNIKIFNATPSLLPLGHRVVSSHRQKKIQESTDKQKYENKNKNNNKTKKRRNATCITGIR